MSAARRPKLAVVPDEAPERIDIQALNRADIERRDWASCHVVADRRDAITLPERRRWSWL